MKLGESKLNQVIPGAWCNAEDGATLYWDLLDPKSPLPKEGDRVAYYAEGMAALTRWEVLPG